MRRRQEGVLAGRLPCNGWTLTFFATPPHHGLSPVDQLYKAPRSLPRRAHHRQMLVGVHSMVMAVLVAVQEGLLGEAQEV